MENGIPLHHELYTIGQSRERQDIAAAEIAHDPDCPMFLISTRPEEKIQKSMAGGFYGLLIFGSLLALGAPWLIQNILIHDESFPVIPAVSTFAVFWIYSFIRWGLMVFNDLIDLKNRVSQAASNIEVHLDNLSLSARVLTPPELVQSHTRYRYDAFDRRTHEIVDPRANYQ